MIGYFGVERIITVWIVWRSCLLDANSIMCIVGNIIDHKNLEIVGN